MTVADPTTSLTTMDAARRALLRGWLVTVCLWIALLQWWPLHAGPWAWWPGALRSMLTRGPDAVSLVTAAQWLAVGWLAGLIARRRGGLRRSLSYLSAAVAVEVVQARVLQRHPSLADAGIALLAAWAGEALATAAPPWVARWQGRLARPGMVAFALVGALLVVRSQWVGPFDTWNAAYPLVIANERTGERPWAGEVALLGIYPRALDGDTIAHLAASRDPAARRAAGAAVLFEGDLVHARGLTDLANPTPRMDLDRRAYGVVMSWDSKAVVPAIQSNGAFSVELRAKSLHRDQHGPARIVSISRTVAERNVTLSQEGDALDVRVGTPWSGDNGTDLGTMRWPGVFDESRPMHLVLTCDGRSVRLYRDGEPVGESKTLPRLGFRLRPAGVDSTGWTCTIATVIALAMPIGLLAASRRAATAGALPMLAACAASAIAWDWRWAVMGAIAAASAALGWWSVRGRASG